MDVSFFPSAPTASISQIIIITVKEIISQIMIKQLLSNFIYLISHGRVLLALEFFTT